MANTIISRRPWHAQLVEITLVQGTKCPHRRGLLSSKEVLRVRTEGLEPYHQAWPQRKLYCKSEVSTSHIQAMPKIKSET